MSLFKYIFLFALAYVVWRLLDSVFSTRTKRPPNGTQGEAQVRPKTNPKPRIPDSEGDYIDFEETK